MILISLTINAIKYFYLTRKQEKGAKNSPKLRSRAGRGRQQKWGEKSGWPYWYIFCKDGKIIRILHPLFVQ